VEESTTFSRKYCIELVARSLFEIEIWCYRGLDSSKWIAAPDNFSTLCSVRADLSPLTASVVATLASTIHDAVTVLARPTRRSFAIVPACRVGTVNPKRSAPVVISFLGQGNHPPLNRSLHFPF
jgi:hypothetical protein